MAIKEVFGNRYVVLARELTKKFEEYIRGTIEEVLSDESNLKGEMVLMVSGYEEETIDKDPMELIDDQINLGLRPKDAIKEVANMLNLNKQQLYKDYIEYKNR